VELASLIAGVGEQCLQEGTHPEQRCQKQDAAIAILDVSGMNDGVQQQAQRVKLCCAPPVLARCPEAETFSLVALGLLPSGP
jgi:hypothetical protein